LYFVYVCVYAVCVYNKPMGFRCVYICASACTYYLFVCLFVLDMTDTLHSTAQYTESTALPNYGLAQAWFKALGTQLTL
jgi:hypothetical protein